ncbi:MAG: MBL fold metallo-hydrolase [candidate division NC10 bacterium]|nr:MBL fold metallo-hydrolase [candidate division NC10 bacterium]
MLVRFHGVRGSIPTCDFSTWQYGGNTPCVEIETPAGHRIILDAGTGLRGLGRTPGWGPDAVPVQASWLLSHYHFGLQPESGSGVESVLQGQMLQPYFPIDMSLLKAARRFTGVKPGDRFALGGATVEAAALHHPQGCLGYRIESGRGIVVYTTDNEPGDRVGDEAIRHLARGADVLIYDAQYSPAILRQRRGWGHSSWLEGVGVARSARARFLILFHHDPDSDDATVGRYVRMAQEQWPETLGAAEGLQINCRTPAIEFETTRPRVGPRVGARIPVRLRGKRMDGSSMEAEGLLVNLTMKGTYVVLPEAPEIGSDVEIVLLESEQGNHAVPGRVVRAGPDSATGQSGVGIVFGADRRAPRSAAGSPPSKESQTP